jgi:tripartite-type tricarboxylate transporter receptor subunit TctC
MLHVPFKGGEVESLSAVMAGTIQGAFGSPGVFRAFQESGKIKVLAVSGTKRSPALPAVPTFSELGYADIDIVGWVGAFVSKGTPTEDIGKLNDALRRALASDSVRERIGVVGFNVDVTSASDFRRQISSEIVRWGVLAKGVKLD